MQDADRSGTLAGQDERCLLPDLSIDVHCDEQSRLKYVLTANNSKLKLDSRHFGPVRIRVDPNNFFSEFFENIDKISSHKLEMIEYLDTQGAFLAEHLLPKDLRKQLWDLRGKAKTVQICSEEGWIPWEMLRLKGTTTKGGEEAAFLCEAFALTRGYRDVEQLHFHLPLRHPAVVNARDPRLPAAEKEASSLEELFWNHGRKILRLRADYHEVTEHLATGAFDVWHFIAHGDADADIDPNSWPIRLDNGELKPTSLYGPAGRFGKERAPLFFLNGCHTARGAHSLTGLGGWARNLLNHGAGAFVGASWATKGEAACEFATTFYRNLLEGVPIAEAVRSARLVIRENFPGDSTWLTYTVFAHPLASCVPPHSRHRSWPAIVAVSILMMLVGLWAWDWQLQLPEIHSDKRPNTERQADDVSERNQLDTSPDEQDRLDDDPFGKRPITGHLLGDMPQEDPPDTSPVELDRPTQEEKEVTDKEGDDIPNGRIAIEYVNGIDVVRISAERFRVGPFPTEPNEEYIHPTISYAIENQATIRLSSYYVAAYVGRVTDNNTLRFDDMIWLPDVVSKYYRNKIQVNLSDFPVSEYGIDYLIVIIILIDEDTRLWERSPVYTASSLRTRCPPSFQDSCLAELVYERRNQ